MKTFFLSIIICLAVNTAFSQNYKLTDITGTYTGYPTNLDVKKSLLPKFKIVLTEDNQFSLSVMKGENWKEEMNEPMIKEKFESSLDGNVYNFKFGENSDLENMTVSVFSDAAKWDKNWKGVQIALLGKDLVEVVLDMERVGGNPIFKEEIDPFLDIIGYYEGVQTFGDSTGKAAKFEIMADYEVKWSYSDGQTWYGLDFSIKKKTFAYDDKGNLVFMFNTSDEQVKVFSLVIGKKNQSVFNEIGAVIQVENGTFLYDISRKGGNPVLKNYASIIKLSPLSIVRANLAQEIQKLAQLGKSISNDISTIYALPEKTALFNRKMMLEQLQHQLEIKQKTLINIQENLKKGLERTAEKNCPESETAITNSKNNIEKSMLKLNKGMLYLDKLLEMENMDSYIFYFNQMLTNFISESEAMQLVLDSLDTLKSMKDECN